MRARTAASFAFACADSVDSGAAQVAAQYNTAAAATHKCRRRRIWEGIILDGKHTSLVPAAILAGPKILLCERMQRLFEFIGHHPYLASAAVLAAAIVAFYEIRERIQSFAALSATQAVRLMNQGALVIDLRGKELYDAGHIGDARNVPVAELASQAESLKKWRDRNVITYCDSGVSGASGARTLMKLGFTKVFNLQGGLNAWLKDNLPLAKTSPGGKGSSK
jgi:rhodanese-related sulfurtransferase